MKESRLNTWTLSGPKQNRFDCSASFQAENSINKAGRTFLRLNLLSEKFWTREYWETSASMWDECVGWRRLTEADWATRQPQMEHVIWVGVRERAAGSSVAAGALLSLLTLSCSSTTWWSCRLLQVTPLRATSSYSCFSSRTAALIESVHKSQTTWFSLSYRVNEPCREM